MAIEHLRWRASAHTPCTALTGDLLLSEMITLASGASRTLKLLPALARHAALWGVPLPRETWQLEKVANIFDRDMDRRYLLENV